MSRKKCALNSAVVFTLIYVVFVALAFAGIGASAFKEGIKKVFNRSASKVITEETEKGLSLATTKLIQNTCKNLSKDGLVMAVKYGNDAVRLITSRGDEGVRFIKFYGERGLGIVRNFGDDAVDVMLKHPGIGQDLIEQGGKEIIPILLKVDRDGAITLARYMNQMVTKDNLQGVLQRIEKEKGRVSFVRIIEILSENGIKVGVGAGIVTGAYQIGKGVRDVTGSTGESVENIGNSVAQKIDQTDPETVTGMLPKTIVQTAGIIIAALTIPWMILSMWKTWLRHRREIKEARRLKS